MKLKYNWGPSLPYYLSAEYNIHPTYIQTMLDKYDEETVLKAIMYLRNEQSNSFDKNKMLEAVK